MAEIIIQDKENDNIVTHNENTQKYDFINLLNTIQILTAKSNLEEYSDHNSSSQNIEKCHKSFSNKRDKSFRFINNDGIINNELKLTTNIKEDQELKVEKNCKKNSNKKDNNCLKNSNVKLKDDGISDERSSCSKASCESSNTKGSCCEKKESVNKINKSQIEDGEPYVFKPSSLTKHMKLSKEDVICIKEFRIKDYQIEELEKSFSRSI